MAKGEIVAGVLAPHPPHLVYAENPPQNEPRAECGWEVLRWGYERCRRNVLAKDPEIFLVHSPHWKTTVGHHLLAVPHFEGLSVDPIFPNLFRYHYDFDVDVELATLMHEEFSQAGLVSKLMQNPDFRPDYGTIASCHLLDPDWGRKVVALSSSMVYHYYGNDVGQEEMRRLGEATRRAVERSGKRVALLASCSLSHRHFTVEPEIPEDMSQEHVYHHGQYLWDMRVLQLMREGKGQQVFDEMPDFIEHATSEVKEGSLSWLMAALGMPDYPAEVHAYGNVIGTGNAVVEWDPQRAGVTA